MTQLVRFRAEAVAEAVDIFRWYESRRPGLGAEFVDALDGMVSRLAENPDAFPKVRNETRRAVLHRFPYAVYFRPADDAIIVLAVHGRQNPTRWRQRE